ncbi:Glycine receptor subunit alpha1like [Caligus rogercresseyi]|uniref:Glycine receptor subunit alpha1like n=1 Tax=Caligus rogercresseyi TaxID=217165 RepID=A0A7T8HG68_CALRO|nr:Glycine receptor subunit alpha1like [Caligus rogercresseyi]
MALLVTLFLVLVNIFNSVTANAPKSEGLTAVETWVVMCILHVFAVLAEYACILKIIQSERTKSSRRSRKARKPDNSESIPMATGGSFRTTYRIQSTSSSGPPGGTQFLEQVYEPEAGGKGIIFLQTTITQRAPSPADVTSSAIIVLTEEEEILRMKRGDSSDSSSGASSAGGGGFLAVRGKVRHRNDKIDRIAMYLFPFFFFIFNFCYWSYYLLFYEVFQDLWK